MEDSELTLELTEADIPGATLSEPLENTTVHGLKWWLLCRNVKCSSSTRKSKLIEMVRKLKSEKAQVIDVDGSYLFKKQNSAGILVDPGFIPKPPLAGWINLKPGSDIVKDIPIVTHGLLYTYLADCAGTSSRGEAFRSLQRGFIHWSSGRLSSLEANCCHPQFCHVQCQMTPSMKQGVYKVYLLFGKVSDYATILSATCECAAGKSASCTHISALLHCLSALMGTLSNTVTDAASSQFHDHEENESEAVLPITSYLCQWKAPKKHNLQMSHAEFRKHVYGRVRKYERRSLQDFDPRPSELRGKTNELLQKFIKSVQGEGLGVSLLFDETYRCWSCNENKEADTSDLPSKSKLQQRVEEFKKCLEVSAQKIRDIEQSTRDQSKSSFWFSVRRYRLTASLFGAVYHRLPTTPPQNLVMQIIKPRHFSTSATEWGQQQEPIAFDEYVRFQQKSGHQDLFACKSGFMICESYPFLGASPDSVVHVPVNSMNPFGLVEIKCPYSARFKNPVQACSVSSFSCELKDNQPRLKQSHYYYCQVQGQMAISGRFWCDFVIYTTKGISVEKINFNADFWNKSLLPKLIEFYDN